MNTLTISPDALSMDGALPQPGDEVEFTVKGTISAGGDPAGGAMLTVDVESINGIPEPDADADDAGMQGGVAPGPPMGRDQARDAYDQANPRY